MGAIIAKQLYKTFQSSKGKKTEAVKNLNLTVPQGQRLAYIGPNGAGKSTSIKMFTGILQPTSGEVEVLGLTPWRQRRQLAAKIGVLFGQRSQLWEELTARKGLHILASIYRIEKSQAKRRIEEVADLLDAQDILDQPVRTFSLGQRMRCELAAAVLHEPELLFLDEPTIGLDLTAKQLFRELTYRLNQEQQTTILLTSHDVSDIEALAERVVVVNHGTIVFDDSLENMSKSLLTNKIINITLEKAIESAQLNNLLPNINITQNSLLSFSITLDTRTINTATVIEKIIQTLPVIDIGIDDPPLEDVIQKIYDSQVNKTANKQAKEGNKEE